MAFTFFFRDIQTLKLIEEHVLPSLKTRMYLDIWDAGCAHGPEPYSLAMILQENMGKFLFRNVRIFATDINEEFGDVIRKGVYPEEQLKRIAPEIFQRHFSPAEAPGQFVIAEAVRNAVTFRRHDLTSLTPIRNGFGLILCKNVLLHLSPEQRVDVFKMFHAALNPDGYLATENTQKMPDELQGMFRQVRRDAQLFQKV
jgi:chemotaxis protein methyltransferase CheR